MVQIFQAINPVYFKPRLHIPSLFGQFTGKRNVGYAQRRFFKPKPFGWF